VWVVNLGSDSKGRTWVEATLSLGNIQSMSKKGYETGSLKNEEHNTYLEK
jgi:hypothetical protein